MLFSSPEFLVFFAGYVLFHVIVPRSHRVYLIICGSTIFYAWWRVEYVWLPYLLMAIGYGGAEWIDRAVTTRARRTRLIVTVVALFSPLVIFKYADFIYSQTIHPFATEQQKLLGLPLPLGISFVTFTVTAYVVDIYRGTFPARQRPSTVLAYVLFFPHLIAGPILRPRELMPQIETPKPAWPIAFTVPLTIFTAGLVKKLIFADQIAVLVEASYSADAPTAGLALLGIYGFAMQIYCDFSGYTDMAIGTALMLGVKLPNNFSRPYCATSPVDFWRRWHITLSFWLRDYLYIPLGGSKLGRAKEVRNILVTMGLGGLWHGANWTFVIWGLMHGIAVTFTHLVRGDALRLPRWLRIVLVFHFVALAWVFFRAPTVSKAVGMTTALASGWTDVPMILLQHWPSVALIVVFLALHRFDDHRRFRLAARLRPEAIWIVITLCWIASFVVSQGASEKLIYFDF